MTKARLVEAGAPVVAASWRVTPDKYEGPREFGPQGSLGFRVAGPQFDFVGGGEPTRSDVPGPAGTDVLEGEK